MSRTPALFVLLVLLLTLPLRAVGAVTMLGCAGHGGVATAGGAHAVAAHAPHHGHDGAAHSHPLPSHDGVHGGHGWAGCQVCGDCCLYVNAMPVTPPLTGMPGQAAPPVFVVQSYTGFQPERPERPPRHTVAL